MFYQNLSHKLVIFKVAFLNSFQLFQILSLFVCISIYKFNKAFSFH